ncbi:MAG: phospholipase D-like domain-containing protein, partial [Acidimicrobiia bacterium]|nr:phospholipase D-like domain-containing protein [Acidimicrobiia bacterium]
RWHDFMVRVTGTDLLRLLRADFDDTLAGQYTSIERCLGSVTVVTNRELAQTFDSLVGGARRRVVVASPYALDRRLVRSLEASPASVRTVVMADRNNFRFLEAITPYLAARAARAGVGLRRYSTFSHSKFLLADDQLLVGSSNFGRHSLTCNQEIGLVISDDSFVARFEAAFLADLRPVRVSQSKRRRLFGWMATAIMECYLIAYSELIAPRVQLLVSQNPQRWPERAVTRPV